MDIPADIEKSFQEINRLCADTRKMFSGSPVAVVRGEEFEPLAHELCSQIAAFIRAASQIADQIPEPHREHYTRRLGILNSDMKAIQDTPFDVFERQLDIDSITYLIVSRIEMTKGSLG